MQNCRWSDFKVLQGSDVNPWPWPWPWDCGLCLGLGDLALAKKSRPLPKSRGTTEFTIVIVDYICYVRMSE